MCILSIRPPLPNNLSTFHNTCTFLGKPIKQYCLLWRISTRLVSLPQGNSLSVKNFSLFGHFFGANNLHTLPTCCVVRAGKGERGRGSGGFGFSLFRLWHGKFHLKERTDVCVCVCFVHCSTNEPNEWKDIELNSFESAYSVHTLAKTKVFQHCFPLSLSLCLPK